MVEQYIGVVVVTVIGMAAAILAYRQWSTASLEEKLGMIDRAVAAAEQLYGHEAGEFRFRWVLGMLRKWLPGEDAEWLEAMIEGAVYRMKERAKDSPARIVGHRHWNGVD